MSGYDDQSLVQWIAKRIQDVIAINLNNYAFTGDRLDIVNLNEHLNLLCRELEAAVPANMADWNWKPAGTKGLEANSRCNSVRP